MTTNELDEHVVPTTSSAEQEHLQEKKTIKDIILLLWSHRKTFYISLPITFIVAVMLSLSIPKTYTVEVTLAPELSSVSGSTSGLRSAMRSLGFGASVMSDETDAILPDLYPDLMNSPAFLVSLFDIPVESKDGKIKTTYYEYLAKHQKVVWWNKILGSIISLIPDFSNENTSSPTTSEIGKAKPNPELLTRRQTEIAKAISNNVFCTVDNKNYVISIIVNAQDPYICATVADSARQRLQEFITGYRTKKARIEYTHMQDQYNKALVEYNNAKEALASYTDANWDLVEEDFVVQKQALQNEMQLRFSALSTLHTQLLMTRAKLHEAKPVFTILCGATVPQHPTSPRKVRFVLMLLFFVTTFQSLWIARKDLIHLDFSDHSAPRRYARVMRGTPYRE